MKEGWERRKLSEVSIINYGYTESASQKEVGPKFLRITDIQNNRVDWELVPYCKCNSDDQIKYKLEDGDIVFARTGATTGKSFLVKKPPEAVFASYLIRLKILSKDFTLPEYLSFYFQTPEYWEYVLSGIIGSAQGGFNATKLGKMTIPIPTISEQKRIVDILDKAFAAISKAKENAEKNLQNAIELFESYLQSVFANPGDEWEEKTIKECFKLKSGDGLTSKEMNQNGKYPVYGGNGIAGKHDNYNLSGENVIIGRVGALCGNARYINENIWLTDNAFKIVDFNYKFDLSFLTYLLNFKKLRSLARQAAQPVISNSSLSDLILQFPKHIEEQQTLSEIFSGLYEESQKLQIIYRQKINDLEELKKSILQKAFNGEIKTIKEIEAA